MGSAPKTVLITQQPTGLTQSFEHKLKKRQEYTQESSSLQKQTPKRWNKRLWENTRRVHIQPLLLKICQKKKKKKNTDGEISPTPWFLVTLSMRREVQRTHSCASPSYTPVPTATQPLAPASFKASNYTNNAIRASNWKRCTSPTMPLQGLQWPTCSVGSCLLEATSVQADTHTLYFIYEMCSQQISRQWHLGGSSTSWLPTGPRPMCDLRRWGDAEPAKLDCKVHAGNVDTTWKEQAASVQHSLP